MKTEMDSNEKSKLSFSFELNSREHIKRAESSKEEGLDPNE
jgi:hypothetical protein